MNIIRCFHFKLNIVFRLNHFYSKYFKERAGQLRLTKHTRCAHCVRLAYGTFAFAALRQTSGML